MLTIIKKWITSFRAKRKAKKIADSLLKICIDLIICYEKSNPQLKPSCLSDVRPYIQSLLKEYTEEFAEWEDDVDHVEVAHNILRRITYSLLISGKYHIYHGILNPMNCSSNIMVVYNKCTEYGVSKNLIDEETKNTEYDALLRRISQVG